MLIYRLGIHCNLFLSPNLTDIYQFHIVCTYFDQRHFETGQVHMGGKLLILIFDYEIRCCKVTLY